MATDGDFDLQLKMEQVEPAKAVQPTTYTDPNDGTVYEWNYEKKAWFPQVDDDFLAAYQASYGIHNKNDNSKADEQSSSETTPKNVEPTENSQGQKRKTEEGWFDIEESKNTKVYISGLPDDITMDEFKEMMGKCGIIMAEEETDTLKLKLYKDSEGNLKGDGLCSYLKRESVSLAMEILDGHNLRGNTIHVELAKFVPKGNYDPNMKKKKKKNAKKIKNPQERLLNWRPEKKFQQRKRNEQVVIIKHMFEPKEFEEDAMLINEIRDDLKEECSKFGEVSKVMIFDNHPEGVTSVKFKDVEAADVCVATLNGRWFAKRQLIAELWDGTTDYKIEETNQEREARLAHWAKFLQGDEKMNQGKNAAGSTETATTSKTNEQDKNTKTDTTEK